MNYLVLYSSNTGNTKILANEIFSAIPDLSKDLIDIRDYGGGKDADTYFVGFWTNRGTCTMDIADFLSGLHGKNIALFGTCGMGGDPDYYKMIAGKASAWLPDDSRYLGAYLCQGKMPMEVRRRYEAMEGTGDPAQVKRLLRNFDEALLHPNDEDLAGARSFVASVLDNLPR